MIVTEEQASQMWCPQVRRHVENDAAGIAGVNRTSDGRTAHDCCVGSRCMSWRWIPYSRQKYFCADTHADKEAPRPADVPPDWEWRGNNRNSEFSSACWLETIEGAKKRRGGYCGLAEKP